MAEVDIDRILENMFNIMLVIHKKILRMDLGLETDNLNRLHVAVMGLLNTSNMAMTELAKALMMTKPQLTHLVETLVALGLVERLPDATDRRVIHLTLTKNGRVKLKSLREKLKENIKQKLASLTPEELTQMFTALETLRNIVSKV
jgi:DNA-binding MarR family transcriptional regulator